MHEPARVKRDEPLEHLVENRARAHRRHRAVLLDRICERATRHVLHHQIRTLARDAEIVDADDVR
jgi:hypothetical protein